MPPPLALALTLLFIAYLFRRDFRHEYEPSRALWIPCIWMLILGSRSVTEWLNLGTPVSGADIAEGNPLDRAVFFLLIAAGLVVLLKRQISWSQLFRDNIWLTVFFLYCGISIVWSDFPFVAFKRWTKGFGDPIMMLIILTEREPIKAYYILLKRYTYILIPLSILFIKYYPHLGRGFSGWTGAAYNTGVTTNKNILGFDLMICGFFLVSRLSARWGGDGKSGRWIDDLGIPVLLLGMVGWLVTMADSKTPLLCLVLALLVYFGLGFQNIRAHVGSYVIGGILAFSALQMSFNITGTIIEGAGRDATLTGRTALWDIVLSMQQYPLLGYGFESFWLGDRIMKLGTIWSYKPTQAHSGYIEMYLNLGWVGLLILSGVVMSCFLKIRNTLNFSPEMTEQINFGRFGMGFLIAFLVYNYTEAGFKSLHPLFVLFLLFAITYSNRPSPVPRTKQTD